MTTNSGHGRRNIDAALAALLAAGKSYASAAAELGVSKSTVERRMASEAFRGAVSVERERLTEEVRGHVVAAGTRATAVLLSIAEQGESEAARVTAARALLELSLRRKELLGISASEHGRRLGDVVGIALGYIEAKAQGAFVGAIEAHLRQAD